jgi:hypothetical protein
VYRGREGNAPHILNHGIHIEIECSALDSDRLNSNEIYVCSFIRLSTELCLLPGLIICQFLMFHII